MSTYDQNLLSEAPRATRAQLQEGYSVDLLQQPPTQSIEPVPIAETDKLGTPAPTSRPSFWRSRTCFVATIVISLIIIGAVVGGAVGGTIKKISDKAAVTTPSASARPSSSSVPAPETTTQTAQGFGGGGSSTSELTAPSPTSTSRPTSTGGQNTGVGASANY